MPGYPDGSSFLPRQIYKVKYEFDGVEEEKFVLVVSRSELNKGHGCTTVMFTTKEVAKRAKFDNCVFFRAGRFGLTEDCVAKCEGVSYTYYEEFMDEVGLVGTIDDRHWTQVVKALGDVFGAACDVPNI